MTPNEQVIEDFYTAFAKRDAAGMIACYHPDVVFSDPVFGELRGSRAGAMWDMLCARGTDLRIEHSNVQADDTAGRAHWEAWYTFGATGKPVHNVIDATFEFKDGKIIRHADTFSFKKWASQALGFSGKMLGGTKFLLNKVRATALKGLDEHLKR